MGKTGRRLLIAGMVLLGSLQMMGYLVGSKALMGLGFMTNASPLPLVFSHFRGLEPFSATYTLTWQTAGGESGSELVTPEVYAGLSGPYNYRNVFGAAFAAGPVFQDDPKEAKLWHTVMSRSFCDRGTLARSFGLPDQLKSIELIVQGRATGMEQTWSKVVTCGE